MQDVKTCTKCKNELPLTAFYKVGGGNDNLRAACKKCISTHYYYGDTHAVRLARAKAQRDADKEKSREYARQWRAKFPDKVKEGQKRHYQENKEKEREDSKRYRAAHPEKYKEYRRQRRARLAEVECTLTVAQWEEVQMRYKYQCAYCGKSKVNLTMDHVVPISKGGSHTADNIVPACKTCNSSKQAGSAPFYVQTFLVA